MPSGPSKPSCILERKKLESESGWRIRYREEEKRWDGIKSTGMMSGRDTISNLHNMHAT
jgi:hypothetical protein